jgi:hypothetical protein
VENLSKPLPAHPAPQHAPVKLSQQQRTEFEDVFALMDGERARTGAQRTLGEYFVRQLPPPPVPAMHAHLSSPGGPNTHARRGWQRRHR